MKTFSRDIYFRKTWRSYQARVLEDLAMHLGDHHLHIIAAPGSGKTVLGLEVVRRLGKPALIFSPTLTIRDQWGERFASLFCPEGYETTPLISKDILSPKLLTLSSYQGLHSAYTGHRALGEEDEEHDESPPATTGHKKALIATLKAYGIKTIVVDEAHHLRNEWWKCLLDLKKQLGRPEIVALTATPPVDVSPWEWERYQELCGPIDSEITVPELVKEKNLCPHQDYIYFSSPAPHEKQTLKAFRDNVREVTGQICRDADFLASLQSHPYVNDPKQHLDDILADPAFFSSIIVFIRHTQKRISRKLMKVLGVRGKRIPTLNDEWLEILLTGCLYQHTKTFPNGIGLSKDMIDTLKRIGALEKRTVQFRSTASIKKLLTSSISKLDSIQTIVQLEHQSLQADLRMVILTDYIRKADLPKTVDDLQPLKRIGVIPIFEVLRRRCLGIRLGVLSGSLVILPAASVALFKTIAQECAIDYERIRFTPLHCDSDYVLVEAGGAQSGVVKAMTCLFNRGGVEVLVGTKSLLGEGWDAPSINSLILASFVGSYMLSNQMRGRAIRTQEKNPDKTSNIWHLVCMEDETDAMSDDYAMIRRRFKSYVGISFKDVAIENGLERLGIDKPPFGSRKLKAMNQQMVAYAMDRAGMRRRWQEAFAANETAQMVEELQSPDSLLPSRLMFTKTIKALLYEGLFAALYVFSHFQYRGDADTDGKFVALFFCVAFGLSALAGLPFFIKALYLFLRYGPVALSMRQIGRALLDALVNTGDIQTPKHKMGVKVEKLEGGFVSCSLSGATIFEKSLFLDALQEILEPIENPRYLLMRMSLFYGLRRKDYHAVPALLGKRKETAEFFADRWKRYLGSSHLIYTRSVEGRQVLVKARNANMASSFQKRSQRRNAWK